MRFRAGENAWLLSAGIKEGWMGMLIRGEAELWRLESGGWGLDAVAVAMGNLRRGEAELWRRGRIVSLVSWVCSMCALYVVFCGGVGVVRKGAGMLPLKRRRGWVRGVRMMGLRGVMGLIWGVVRVGSMVRLGEEGIVEFNSCLVWEVDVDGGVEVDDRSWSSIVGSGGSREGACCVAMVRAVW